MPISSLLKIRSDRDLQKIRRGQWPRLWEGVVRYGFRWRPPEGVRVVEADWDYLILLDACRYDIFKEENWLDGRLEKRISRGSTSVEFLNRNFTEYHDDIVYVSANGFVNPYEIHSRNYQRQPFDSSKHFHDVYPVFLDDAAQEDGVTRPEAVTTAAIDADTEHPNKRKIIHYAQPHLPFIRETKLIEGCTDYQEMREMGYSREDLLNAYRANLRRGLHAVENLLEKIKGRIVISADHGEALGEWGLWEHPHSVYIRPLVEVPWHMIENEERPVIKGENTMDEIDI